MGDAAAPAAATLALGVLIPLAGYTALLRRGRFSAVDAAWRAAHYGTVWAVTFTAAVVAIAFLVGGIVLGAFTGPPASMPSLALLAGSIVLVAAALYLAGRRAGHRAD